MRVMLLMPHMATGRSVARTFFWLAVVGSRLRGSGLGGRRGARLGADGGGSG